MANPSLEEILSRLNINGSTNIGGSSFPNYLVATNSNGQIDPSLFSSTTSVYEVTTAAGGLASITDPKLGELAILDNSIAYVRSLSGWVLISYSGAASLPFSGPDLASTDIQSAINELATRALLIDANRIVTGQIAFNTGALPPFTTNSTAPVLNLTATNLSVAGVPKDASYFRDASNLNAGIVDPARLSPTSTYNITASRATTATTANNALHANSAGALDVGVIVAHALLADTANLATTAAKSLALDVSGVARDSSYFRNISNINAGTLPSGRFDDVSHGVLGSGTVVSPAHAIAVGVSGGTTAAPGFMSASDKIKLDTIAAFADVNIPSYTGVRVGGTTLPAVNNPVLTLAAGGSNITLTPNTGSNTVTIALNTAGISHHDLSNLTNNDDHTQYVNVGATTADTGRVIKAQHTFNTAGAPFVIDGTSKNVLVPFLNAELLSGHPTSYFTDIKNIVSTGIIPSWLGGPSGIIQTAITDVLTGNLTFGNIDVDGVTATGLTLNTLSGGGLKLVGADNNGVLTQTGINTDLLSEGPTNKFYTAAKLYAGLKDSLLPASGNTLTWTYNDTNNTLTPVLALTTTQVTEGTRKYLSESGLTTLLANTATRQAVILALSQLANVNAMAIGANANTIAVRTPSGGLIAAGIQATNLTVSGSTTLDSLAVTNKITSGVVESSDPANTVTTKAYVDAVAEKYSNEAVYDLPVRSLADTEAAAKQDVSIGQAIIEVDGASYNIINGISSDGQLQVTGYEGNLTSLAKDGFITSVQFGNLLKTANLVNSPAAANIFCPEFRTSEPFIYQAGSLEFTDKNWRITGKNGVQLRGRKSTPEAPKNYLLLLRLQGVISLRHEWTLSYYTYEAGNYVKHTYTINEASRTLPPIENIDVADMYSYVDKNYAIFVAGKSSLSIEYAARSGFATETIAASFDGIAPFSDGIVGSYKPSFNGGFINLKPLSVWSANPNEPFSPYIPDSLVVQSEGELVSGGASYYPTSTANDIRVYDGEDIIDNQAVITGLVKTTDDHGFSSYVVTDGDATAYDKACLRSSLEYTNKQLGINGFLRDTPIVTSGAGISPSLAVDSGVLNSMLIADVNKRLAVPLPTSTFTLFGKTITLPGNPTFGHLVAAINEKIATCIDPDTGIPTDINWFTLNYTLATDRFSLELHCPEAGENPSIFDDADPLLSSLKLVFGVEDRSIAQSIPNVAGIAIATDGSTPLSQFYLKVPITIYSGEVGSFSIDGNTVTYRLTNSTDNPIVPADTFATLQGKLENVGFGLTYNKLSNEFEVSRLPGYYSDTAALLPPRIYDINGTLMTALGLEKESNGNADLPPQTVHRILSVSDGLVLAGNFRSYNGATSPGLVKIGLDGKIKSKFDLNLGFSTPIHSIAAYTNNNILAAPDRAASLNGYNKKSIFCLDSNGAENLEVDVREQPISGDNQDRILDVISAHGDFLVLTPRKLLVYNASGVCVNTYTGTKSFQGMTKFKDVGSKTYFVLTSTAYSSATAQQSIVDSSGLETVTPAGLRMMIYDPEDNQTVKLDPLWKPSSAAGVGAAASCAYPIIGGSVNDPYVICANRAGWWNTGITNEEIADWSWNVTKKGNLFLRSEAIGEYNTTETPNELNPWYINYLSDGPGSISYDTESTTLTVTDNTSNGEAYVQQTFDASYYQHSYQLPNDNTNPGGVVYELDIEMALSDLSVTTIDATHPYAFIELRFSNNSASNPGLEYAIGAQVDLRNMAISNRAIGYIPEPLPSSVIADDIQISAIDSGVGTAAGRTIIRIIAKDTSPAFNKKITGRLYPAYNTTSNSSSSSPCTGTAKVYRTALRYGIWGSWEPIASAFNGSEGVYVQTADTKSLPSGEGTNSDNFKGLYKISLADTTKGKAYPDFSVSQFGFVEGQSHAIPFTTDSEDNIYVGGPINSIGGIPVTPWRLYKLSPLGYFDQFSAFNTSAQFNDKVTSCIAVGPNHLAVSGAFTAYNNRAVNKFTFLTLDGEIKEDISQASSEVIISAVAPDVASNPELANKMWLDISGNTAIPPTPAVLMVYDKVSLEWVNLLNAGKRIGDPFFITTPTDTTIDPVRIDARVAGYTVKSLEDYNAGHDIKDVVVTYWIDSLGTAGQNYIPVSVSAPDAAGIVLPNDGQTHTVFLQATAPSNANLTESRVISKTFVTHIQTNAPTVTSTKVEGHDWEYDVALNITEGTLYYYVYPAASPVPTNPTIVAVTGSTSLRITADATIVAWAQAPGKKASEKIITTLTMVLGTAAIVLDNSDPNDPLANISCTGGGSGLLYSVGAGTGGSDPTGANYNSSTPPSDLMYDAGNTIINLLGTSLFAQPQYSNEDYTSINVRLLDHPAFGTGNSLVIKAKAVIRDPSTFKIVSEQTAITTYTVTRLAAPAYTPNGVMVRDGDKTYSITVTAGGAIHYDFNTTGPLFSTAPSGIHTTGNNYIVLKTITGLVYENFTLRTRAFDTNNLLVPSAITSVPFVWKRGSAAVAPVNFTADGKNYGDVALRITPQLTPSSKNHIAYSFVPGITLNRITASTDTVILWDGLSDIDAQNIPADLYPAGVDTISFTVLEWNDDEPISEDTKNVSILYRVPTSAPFIGLHSIPDDVDFTETPAGQQNILTFDTSGAGGYVLEVKSFSQNMITCCTYNNAAPIIAGEADLIILSENDVDSPKFTPPVSAITAGDLALRVKFFKQGYLPSRTIVVNIAMALPKVTFSEPAQDIYAGQELGVVLRNPVTTAQIYYTLGENNEADDVLGQNYTEPIIVKAAVTINARAYLENWTPSANNSITYTGVADDHDVNKYGLINIKCGTPYKESAPATYTSSKTLITFDSAGKVVEADDAVTFGAQTNLRDNWAGKAVFGLSDRDYWNVIKEKQSEEWQKLIDARGKGNANGILQTRKYFNVNDATPYFGKGIQDPTNPTAVQVTGLENCGLTAEYGDNNILLHTKGLDSGKYLMLAYGQNTVFDLDMYNGTCISKDKSKGVPAFYNYGTQLFNTELPKTYLSLVVPVRVFQLKALKKKAGTGFEWVVSTGNSTYVSKAFWDKISTAGDNAIVGQKFYTSDNLVTPTTTNGILYMPSYAADGIDGYWYKDVAGKLGTSNIAIGKADSTYLEGNTALTGGGANFTVTDGCDFLMIAPALQASDDTEVTDLSNYVTDDLTTSPQLQLSRLVINTGNLTLDVDNLTKMLNYVHDQASITEDGRSVWPDDTIKWCCGVGTLSIPVLRTVNLTYNAATTKYASVLTWDGLPVVNGSPVIYSYNVNRKLNGYTMIPDKISGFTNIDLSITPESYYTGSTSASYKLKCSSLGGGKVYVQVSDKNGSYVHPVTTVAQVRTYVYDFSFSGIVTINEQNHLTTWHDATGTIELNQNPVVDGVWYQVINFKIDGKNSYRHIRVKRTGNQWTSDWVNQELLATNGQPTGGFYGYVPTVTVYATDRSHTDLVSTTTYVQNTSVAIENMAIETAKPCVVSTSEGAIRLAFTAAGSDINFLNSNKQPVVGDEIVINVSVTDTAFEQVAKVTDLSYTDTDITPNTTYYYSISATTDYGDTEHSNSLGVTTPNVVPPVISTAVAANSDVTVSWTAVDNGTSYTIKRKFKGSPDTAFIPIGVINSSVPSGTPLSYVDALVYPDTTPYVYVVTASDGLKESINSNAVETAVSSLIGPTEVSATIVDATAPYSVIVSLPTTVIAGPTTVSEYYSTHLFISKFNVYRKRNGVTIATKIGSISATAYTYTDLNCMDVLDMTSYKYAISAIYPHGETLLSDWVTATQTPQAPIIEGTLDGNGKPVISWESVPGATSYDVYRSDSSGTYTTPIANIIE